MIPSAPVDICNLACDLMGEAPISSVELPTTEKEELFARWYDACRQLVLREQVWNFAQKTREIARTGDGEGLYADSYNLPNDFVRLNGVGEDPRYPITQYEITERAILASEGSSIIIRYNKDITNVASMDAAFVNMFALRLAVKTAYKITKKKSIVKDLNEMIVIEEPKARGVDGQERPPIRVQRSRYLRARAINGPRQSGRYYEFD